ncbi:MAG: 3-oxoacyl-ACP reductase [Alphaproteobacteria bacterium]|jgi:acetoacetyl-CoA reductase|nr:3-oxoacyl-ACP reductase [Candidatus Jidaibacter sp.]
MSNRRVLITGGTRGIGASVAQAFKQAGYNVAVSYASNDAAAQEFERNTGIKAFKWNVANFNDCQEGIRRAEEHLGGNVEVLINNAGITRDGMMHKMPQDNWNDVIINNLSSVFNMSRNVIDKMRENKFGRIISMSSVNANGMMGQTNYSAAKAGIEGFTKALALESARSGITVNAVAPGYINTEMVAAVPQDALANIIAKVPAGRLGDASEIANTILFLAQDNSAFITGAVVPVNGGLRT